MQGLPTDVVVTNLGESVWGNAAKTLKEDLQQQQGNNARLVDRFNALEKSHKAMVSEHVQYKSKALRSLVEFHKRQAINSSSSSDAPRTNAWTVGDYVKIREPAPKKRKKKATRRKQKKDGGRI